MPTVPSETIIRAVFDDFWGSAKLHGWDINYKLKSEIESVEEEIVEELKSYKNLEEWEEEWYDTKEEVEDEAYWRGHEDGVDQGYSDAKMECESCSQ
jgi:ppGpp synthetase/RelA/SpoT-type nucleotidyltranferase